MKSPVYAPRAVLRHGLLLSGLRCSSAASKFAHIDRFDANNLELSDDKKLISVAGNMSQMDMGIRFIQMAHTNQAKAKKQSRVCVGDKDKGKDNGKGKSAIAGKNIIFVAGLGCIGFDTSREIVKKGPKNLVLLDTIDKPEALCELKDMNKKTKITYYKYDVTVPLKDSKKLLKKIFDKFKKIDLLINGAGILDDHKIEKTIAVNFTGTVNTTTAIMDHWDIRNGGPGGVIANICSVTAFNPIYQVPVYCASKTAAFSFTNSLAKLSKITGVKAYSINPGITKTTLVQDFNSWIDVEPCVADLLLEHPTQTTKQAGKSFVKAIEANKNGAIWKLDLGELEEVKWCGFKHWDPRI